MRTITKDDKTKSVVLTPGEFFTSEWTGKEVFRVDPTIRNAEPVCKNCALDHKSSNAPTSRVCAKFACLNHVRGDGRNVVVRKATT